MGAVAQGFKVTYYVGVMLAQGGTLAIQEAELRFSPSTLEKAMGAEEISVPYASIKSAEITGTITESLLVRTKEKVHRFVGSDLDKILNSLNDALRAYQANPRAQAAKPAAPNPNLKAHTIMAFKDEALGGNVCSSCAKPMRADFNYCPFCRTPVSNSCDHCHKRVEEDWKYCVYCSSEIS